MSDPAIGAVLTALTTILDQLVRRQVQLITGVGKEIRRLESEFKSIGAVLADAERRQVKEQAVRIWLENLYDIAQDADDVLSEWTTAIRKAQVQGLENKFQSPSSSPTTTKKVYSIVTHPCLGFNSIKLRRDIALKIEKINERLADIAKEKDRYNFTALSVSEVVLYPERLKTTSYVDLSEVKGRVSDMDNITTKLLSENYQQNQGLNVVSLVGMGGMGKTTLARLVYYFDKVASIFEKRIWVCVSEPFDEVRVAKAILESVEGSTPNMSELETVTQKIRHHLEKRKFLLVLDDVWTEDFSRWEQIFNTLSSGACGSTVLVTTRMEKVAKVMGSKYVHHLGKLSGQESWALFEKIALFERREEEFARFEVVGRRIADKCKGRPLTVKTIASLMRFKSSLTDWENVCNSEFWELEEAKELFPPLMLSYYDLPPDMKQCFSFCAFFPKDYVIEADNLVRLWMALGYLRSNENVKMEVIGQEYLQSLAARSFFENLVLDKDGKTILSVKMHDMIHDLAQYLAKNECCVIEYKNSSDLARKIQSSGKRARHLTVVRGRDNNFPSVPNVERLFTLWVQSFFDSPPIISRDDQIDPDLFRWLSCIKALDLSRNRIGEVPKEIGTLIKLKYLNLSHNPFWELPQSLCDLFNLQTLNLFSCNYLSNLPREIDKLVNLRHLEIGRTENLKTLPKGISKIETLQTLTKFIIIKGNDQSNPTCSLEDLNNLKSLRGCLKIEGLGCVTNANEAKKADLHKKIHISDLHFDFSLSIQNANQERVLEALEAPENLQSLQISSYCGTKFPNWMMKLTNLDKLILQDCKNCSNLPPLGKLPSLVTLHLEGLNSVKSIGLDFLGIHTNNEWVVTKRVSGSGALSAFPKLKKLKISNMQRWEEWNMESRNESFEIMPRLRVLKVLDCEKLKALPGFLNQKMPNLKMRITNCTLLQRKSPQGGGENWSQIP